MWLPFCGRVVRQWWDDCGVVLGVVKFVRTKGGSTEWHATNSIYSTAEFESVPLLYWLPSVGTEGNIDEPEQTCNVQWRTHGKFYYVMFILFIKWNSYPEMRTTINTPSNGEYKYFLVEISWIFRSLLKNFIPYIIFLILNICSWYMFGNTMRIVTWMWYWLIGFCWERLCARVS